MTTHRSNVRSIVGRVRRTRPEFQFLFSYGTLQQESVQLAIFGRRLTGMADGLPMFSQAVYEVLEGAGARTNRKKRYPIVKYSGRVTDVVHGTALRVTTEELRKADEYEGMAYKRIAALLQSGACAWVYADARNDGSWRKRS